MARFTPEQEVFLRSLEEDAMAERRRKAPRRIIRPSGTSLPDVELLSSANPQTTGGSVTFTAKVHLKKNPTGTVTFFNGASQIGAPQPLSGGQPPPQASITTTLAVGTHPIRAQYSGDGNNAPASSSILNQTIGTIATTTTLGSSPNPSGQGATVTLTATVLGGGTGTVTFFNGTTSIGSGSVSGGIASMTTSALLEGEHHLTAKYGGDATHTASTSPVVVQVVTMAGGPVMDLVADFNAPAGGGDATQAFLDWRTFAGQEANRNATLTIPAGYFTTNDTAITFGCKGDVSIIGVASPTPGALPLTRINALHIGTPDLWAPGHPGMDASTQSFLNDVNAGTNVVPLKTASEASRFTPGMRVLVSGLCIMGGDIHGYPPNTWNVEYFRVVSSNTTAGTVTLDGNLRFSYRDEWPAAGVPYLDYVYIELGPAMISILPTQTDQKLTFKNIWVSNASEDPNSNTQVFFQMTREVLFENMAFDHRGPAPGMTEQFTWIGSPKIGNSVEVDKLVGSVTIQDCHNGLISFQSASIIDVLIEDCSNFTNVGNGRFHVFNNCEFNDCQIGAGHGQTEQLEFHNCTFNATNGAVWPLVPFDDWMNVFSNGTFTFPIGGGHSNFAMLAGYQNFIPGMKMCIVYYGGQPVIRADDGLCHGFTVLAVRTDQTNFIVDIDKTTLPTNLTFLGVNPATSFYRWPVQPGPIVDASSNFHWEATYPELMVPIPFV